VTKRIWPRLSTKSVSVAIAIELDIGLMTQESQGALDAGSVGVLKGPLLAQCEITEACNQSCYYCYNHWRPSRSGQALSPELATDIVNKIADLNIVAIALTGGEPLLCKSTVDAAISTALARNLLVSLNTNASLLDRKMIEQYIAHRVYFLVSLPSSEPHTFKRITGSDFFPLIIENIRTIAHSGGMITINMVVNDLNVHEIEDTAHFALGLGVTCFRATPVSPPQHLLRSQNVWGLSIENYEAYFMAMNSLRRHSTIRVGTLGTIPFCMIPDWCQDIPSLYLGCTAGRGIVTVGTSGDIRPCSQADFSVGNILRQSSNDILNALTPWQSREYLPNRCRECAEATRCNGGCRMFAAHANGDMKACDPRMTDPVATEIHLGGTTNDSHSGKFGGECISAKPHVRWRREAHGYWSVFSGDYYDILNESGMKLFRYFFVDGHVLPNEIPPRLGQFVGYFLSRGYLTEPQKSEDDL